jgi:hypothetical protein
MARTTKFYHYEVVGYGPFPFDMLRYDAAWPAGGPTVSYMALDYRQAWELGVVTLGLVGLQPPTEARWQSFGWRVQNVGTVG